MLGNFKFGGVSVQGQSHQATSTPCQDANLCYHDEILSLLAVADGLGSCLYSDIAAEIAVNAAKEYCQKSRFISIKKLFHYCRGKILRYAKAHKLDPEQMHTTLLVLVAIDDRLLAGQIGDGAVVFNYGEQFTRIFQQQLVQKRGPVNVTSTLLQKDYHLDVLYLEEVLTDQLQSIFLMTDGVTPVSTSYQDESAYQPFFEYLLKKILLPTFDDEILIKRAENLLMSEQFSMHSKDDKTLAFAINNTINEI